ncbi:L,D-transpeptidase [Synechococcus sp. BIOS-E4-1]|uniref:L,D-transpeptidase n=1 Tax=Synechococcus sp. BIOS-E4-1 TaxID=1400864 RepID=UPI00210803F2|nr:L,D-transpeptidase [Synechococcus sp. BIOS-E4-1]
MAVGAVSVALAASGSAVASPQLQAPLFASAKVHSVNAETSIHLDLKQRRISVIRAGQSIGRWPVAIGDPKTPTPTGVFRVETKLVNPQYESTKSGRVHPVTGPASPLGHRWIGFLQQGPNQFGIHGTPWPHWVKIRAAVSNGCVRMLNAHVQKLYELVDVGTPVMITR